MTEPTRRALLCGAAGCLAMAACGGRAGATATTSAPSSPSPSPTSGAPATSPSASAATTPLAESAAIREGAPFAVTLPDGRPAFLVRGADGVRLLDGTCTHAACAIAWDAGHKAFLCPCHLSRFDLTGRVLTPPATDPLPSVPVQEHDGRVYLAG